MLRNKNHHELPAVAIVNRSSSYCQMLKGRLEQPLMEADWSHKHVRSLINAYAMAEFRKTPKDMQKSCCTIGLHFRHAIDDFVHEDFDTLLTTNELNCILSCGGGGGGGGVEINPIEVASEMQNIYLSLVTLKHVFQSIIVDRRRDHHHLLNNSLNSSDEQLRELHVEGDMFFVAAYECITKDLREVILALKDLNITKPVVPKTMMRNTSTSRKNREWLAAVEYLKVLQYIRSIYRFFFEKATICS